MSLKLSSSGIMAIGLRDCWSGARLAFRSRKNRDSQRRCGRRLLGDLARLTILQPPTYGALEKALLDAKASDKPLDLLTTIAHALDVGTAKIGPADFAMQMVKGPEQLTFSFKPPAKPVESTA